MFLNFDFAVNLAYGNWLKGNFYPALSFLIFATVIFRCDTMLLLGPIGLELLLTKSISFWKALKYCVGTALLAVAQVLPFSLTLSCGRSLSGQNLKFSGLTPF